MPNKKTELPGESLLAALTAARSPLTPDELAGRLDLAPAQQTAFDAELTELERAGRVVRNRAGLLLVAARANLLSGQVQGHRDGFGFLLRDDGGPDLMLPEHEMSKVLHGDLVLARPAGLDRRGRQEGEIVEVIEHRTNTLVGRDARAIRDGVAAILAGQGKRGRTPQNWDGRAAERIAADLYRWLAAGAA